MSANNSNTPDRLFRRILARIAARQWVVLYRGSDEKRYAALVQQLTAAGIDHRVEEFDQLSKTMTSSQIPGRSPMDNTIRRDNPNFSASQTVLSDPLRENTGSSYSILVRQRDLAAANRLHRSGER